jgi:hypothetical protein
MVHPAWGTPPAKIDPDRTLSGESRGCPLGRTRDVLARAHPCDEGSATDVPRPTHRGAAATRLPLHDHVDPPTPGDAG